MPKECFPYEYQRAESPTPATVELRVEGDPSYMASGDAGLPSNTMIETSVGGGQFARGAA
jgi:hypothetical protein